MQSGYRQTGAVRRGRKSLTAQRDSEWSSERSLAKRARCKIPPSSSIWCQRYKVTKVIYQRGETSIQQALSAVMFALSTNNNNPQNPQTMNKIFSSVFAAALALASTAAMASTPVQTAAPDAEMNTADRVELTMEAGRVSMRIIAGLPDGSRQMKKGHFTSMSGALVAYHQFISTLPHGSQIISVVFRDDAGNTLFSSQG